MTPPKQPQENAFDAVDFDTQEAVKAKISTLYITTRYKYIMQTDSGYVTFNANDNPNVKRFNEYTTQRHLEGIATYGVFDARTVTKFITFDVDFREPSQARWATAKLIDTLVNDFNVSRTDIHVSLSGSKGYHVDLFFDSDIPVADARLFYDRVMHELGTLPGGMIEYRPTFAQGVKLPLGIHKRTGNRCWFVDRDTFEPIEAFEYILEIEPMPAEVIYDALIHLTAEQEQEIAEIKRRTDVTVTALDTSEVLHKAARIIEAGRLTMSGTRHNTTLTLAVFFKSQGLEPHDAIDEIMRVLTNTPREYFNPGSTPQYWLKEAERLVKYAYSRDMPIGNADKPVRIFKSEMLAVLSVGTFRQKQLAYAMLITSKRYGRVFYLTMNTAMEMLGTKAKATVNDAIKQLVKVGFIEYVRKGEIDRAKSYELGRAYSKPNTYRILCAEPIEGEPSFETVEGDLADDVHKVVPPRELRAVLSRRDYERFR